MGMTILSRWANHDMLCAITLFSDGVIVIEEEKAYVEFGPDGVVIQRTWKEEPGGAHYAEIRNYDGPEVRIPDRTDDNSSSPFEALVFMLTRRPEIVLEVCTGNPR